MITTTCDCCGKEIQKKEYDLKRFTHKFCSKECRNLYSTKSKTVPCAHCGKPVVRTNSTINKSTSDRFFCNKSCSASANNALTSRTRENHPNWVDGSSSYTVHKKDACERCGYSEHKEILQVHHIDRDRLNNVEANLETLCPNCHCIEHYVINKNKKL